MKTPLRSARSRTVLWAVAAVGVLAIVAWQAATWSGVARAGVNEAPGSTSGSTRAGDGADVSPGLTRLPAGGRIEAPPFEGRTLGGGAYASSRSSGHVMVVNVWGSWCGPCRAETPDLIRLAREYQAGGVRFVGIDTRDNEGAARAFVRKFGVPYPSLVDEGEILLSLHEVVPAAVVPSTLIIDQRGKVAARVLGRVNYQEMRALLDDELASARASDQASGDSGEAP